MQNCGPASDTLHQYGEPAFSPVTHGERSAQKLAGQRQRYELTRSRDAGTVPQEAQQVYFGRDSGVLRELKSSFFHQLSMVLTVMVVSSSTSSSTRTVSSEVKIVTLFSVAQRRMMTPSSRWRPLWMARVLMM